MSKALQAWLSAMLKTASSVRGSHDAHVISSMGVDILPSLLGVLSPDLPVVEKCYLSLILRDAAQMPRFLDCLVALLCTWLSFDPFMLHPITKLP